MKDGFVVTKNHGRIHYLEEGSGKPVILLQSNGNSAHEYADMIPLLAKTRRVIAWDQPGQGDSDRITRHYTIQDYSNAVVEFMDALDLKTASVLGSSIGGTITIDLGVRHASRIDSLFITEAPIRTPEEWVKEWPRTERNWSYPIQTREEVAPRLQKLTDEVFWRWNIDRQKAGPWTMVDVMWAIREFDAASAIKSIKTKTMVIFGLTNRLHGASSLYEKDLPSAKIVKMKDCGHFPMIDDPAGLTDLVDKFIG